MEKKKEKEKKSATSVNFDFIFNSIILSSLSSNLHRPNSASPKI